jgi:anaerobic magnesium-protoporphyrin IX monomethyl ester cyclase
MTSCPTSNIRPARDLISGGDLGHPLDLLLVQAPLRDYALRPRVNDFTLPVLGMAYIATAAAARGFNTAVLDAEAHGLGVAETAGIVNRLGPRWVGMNLLAPTYQLSADIAAALDPGIHLMLGGHHAKALPTEILTDPRMARCKAMVLGEGESRVPELLADPGRRRTLPGVMWLDPVFKTPVSGAGSTTHLAPDIDALPFVDRTYLPQDPREIAGRVQANMVGARGCPYDCSFCGAAVSANPDVTIRVRKPGNIIDEMHRLRDGLGVTSFRFVDDLFLGAKRVIEAMMGPFRQERIGEWAVWDATGRINVLDRIDDAGLDRLHANGLREVALGIESGNAAMLQYIDKRITPEMVVRVARRLFDHGIAIKGYFIVGFPDETEAQIDDTVTLVDRLWGLADTASGSFTASMFQFRPYPGTPEWHRLMATGRYSQAQLLDYAPVDLTDDGRDPLMVKRDEFNFAVAEQLSAAPTAYVHAALKTVSRTQHARNLGLAAAAHAGA